MTEKEKAVMLVVVAASRDGRKVVLAEKSGVSGIDGELAGLLRDPKGRGLRHPGW